MKNMNRRESKKIAVMAAIIVGFMLFAFMPLASATVNSFTVTPSTGLAGAVDSYNVLVTTDGVTSLNITIPAGFIGVVPMSGGVELVRIDFWNSSTRAYYGHVTFTANDTNPTTKIDAYCELGGATARTTQTVNYTPGATNTFESGFGGDTSSVRTKLPTETVKGSINVTINCTAFYLDDVMFAIKQFVRNPSAGDYDFFADGVKETVTITAAGGRGIIFRDGIWHADTNGDHITDIIFAFGQADDLSVVGDINQDGREDTAIFRPGDGAWHVDTTGNHITDIIFAYGQAGDLPVVGDINRDGKDDIAVFRAGVWHVATNGGPPFIPDLFIPYGQAGDIPLVGDITQDGKDDIAIFRIFEGAGAWHIDTNGGPPFMPDIIAQYGQIGDKPVVGDINRDSLDDIAIFRIFEGLGVWHVDTTAGPPFIANQLYQYGEPGDKPLAGDI